MNIEMLYRRADLEVRREKRARHFEDGLDAQVDLSQPLAARVHARLVHCARHAWHLAPAVPEEYEAGLEAEAEACSEAADAIRPGA